jgi:FkbM family methyltransferase
LNCTLFLAHILPETVINFSFKVFSILKGYGYQPTLRKEVELCLKKLGHRPQIFVEIGVHHGEYVKEVLKKIPNIKCYLFEPSKVNFKILDKKFKKFKKIQLFNFALSSVNKNGKLYFEDKNNPGSALSSLYKRHFFRNQNFEKIKIRRFDKIFKNKCSIVDFVKIDVEGEELNCIYGFGNLIKKVKLIQFEFGGTYIDSKNYFKDIYQFLKKFNFDIYIMTPKGLKKISEYSENLEYFVYSNYVGINKNL